MNICEILLRIYIYMLELPLHLHSGCQSPTGLAFFDSKWTTILMGFPVKTIVKPRTVINDLQWTGLPGLPGCQIDFSYLSNEKKTTGCFGMFRVYIGYGPFPVTVTTRPGLLHFLVGNPYKPLCATVTGKGPHPRYICDYTTQLNGGL